MLQFGHVYAWAREHDRSVMSMRFSYKYRYFAISSSRYANAFLYVVVKYAAKLGLISEAKFQTEDCDSDALERRMLRHRHIVVSGWFCRWYDLFLKYRSEICSLFAMNEAITTSVRKRMAAAERATTGGRVRLGVHIRRGDYKNFCDGQYYYDDATYAAYIAAFARMMSDKTVEVFLSTNDAAVSAETISALIPEPEVCVHLLGGNAAEDLYMLSECDYLIGPPSTYSLVAAMYRDIPLCRMDQTNSGTMSSEDFKLFDYWFRRIV